MKLLAPLLILLVLCKLLHSHQILLRLLTWVILLSKAYVSHTSARLPRLLRHSEDFENEQWDLYKKVQQWLRLGKHTNDQNLHKMNQLINAWVRNMEDNILS